ncbi:hypothetical protein [Halorussus litoreus]|uniref:hypothetical protein n=1 Tax=Halorussus litoreus TaxID=1710536 RepID=UPI000E276BC2|nr:hypothetical protein [Halorussus litoreus]
MSDGREDASGADEDEAADGQNGADSDDPAIAPEGLQYPEFVFGEGEIADDGSFELDADLDREELREWVEDLAGGLGSHDVAVESPDGYVTLGVAPEGVRMEFDPDESGVGEFEFTVEMRAKAMFVASDPDGEKVGARGGTGFVPIEMLTGEDGDAEEFRCYNWIDEPTDP